MNIINLSSKTLTEDHINVLNKGLSFVPTNSVNEFDVEVDMFKFFRNVKLREFFDKSDTTDLSHDNYLKPVAQPCYLAPT